MAEVDFEQIRFEQDGEGSIRGVFLKLYRLNLDAHALTRIGLHEVEEGKLVFPQTAQDKVDRRFPRILDRALGRMTNTLTGNPTLFVSEASGIPLQGSLSFGIVDKGSGLLEVKPLSSCNTSCVFCSVDEGFDSRKITDVLVEPDYLAAETRRLLDEKRAGMHIYLNPQGEPLLYTPLPELVAAIKKSPFCERVSVITNAKLLTPGKARELAAAGVDSFNVSIHTLDDRRGKEIMHDPSYSVRRVCANLDAAASHAEVILSPVWLPGETDADIEDLISFAKERGWQIMIQNFQTNPRGRNPVKATGFEDFFAKLEQWERRFGVKLRMSGEIKSTRERPKPFQKGERIKARLVAPGRYPHESLAVAQGRAITVRGAFKKERDVWLTITRDAHNVFYATPV